MLSLAPCFLWPRVLPSCCWLNNNVGAETRLTKGTTGCERIRNWTMQGAFLSPNGFRLCCLGNFRFRKWSMPFEIVDDILSKVSSRSSDRRNKDNSYTNTFEIRNQMPIRREGSIKPNRMTITVYNLIRKYFSPIHTLPTRVTANH